MAENKISGIIETSLEKIKNVVDANTIIGTPINTPGGTTVATLEAFTDELLEEYIREFGGARNAMFRLKENWQFLLGMFDDNEKLRKRLLKTTDVAEFRAITHQILHALPLRSELYHNW